MSCSRDWFIMRSLALSYFNGLRFEWVSVAKLRFNGLCLSSETRFQWFIFRVNIGGLCFTRLYCVFQAKTWVDITWCAHNDLCKLNTIYSRMISYVSKIIVSCFLFDCMKVWPNTKIFLCLWHVRRTWQKQAWIKIKDVAIRAEVLKNMVHITHDITQPHGRTLL
jgi:hypothetical protein